MKASIHLVVPKVLADKEIDGWVCGVVSPVSNQPHSALTAIQATHPWVSQDDPILDEERAKQALEDFVNLEPGVSQEAVDFLNRYGLFSHGDCVTFGGQPDKVRTYWTELERAGKRPFAMKLDNVWWLQRRIRAVVTLYRAERKHQTAALRNACKEINPHLTLPRTRNLTGFRNQILSHLASQGLSQVQLGVAPIKGIMAPVITTDDLQSALYIVLLFFLTKGARFRDCANRNCRHVFLHTRSDKKFCSNRCQALVKAKRYRKRHKNSSPKQAM
ncbi:MAG: CGNR zinc finger domain-containing protein [Candidatus Acidiferrales bacterium]